jgi:CRISPR-associated protein Csm5
MNINRMPGVLRLTPLTPVHVGSGEVYTPVDYDRPNGRFEVKDVRKFFEDHRDDVQHALDAVEHGLALGPDYVRYSLPVYGEAAPCGRTPAPQAPRPAPPKGALKGGPKGGKVDPKMAKLMKQSEKKFGPSPAPGAGKESRDRDRSGGGEVRAFIKDPFGNPFLPATSVKGCLRTAIACALAPLCKPRPAKLVLEKDRPNRQWAFSPVNAKLFGAGATEDLLKVLVLRDSAPLRIEALALSQVRIMDVFRERFEEKRGVPIQLEALMPGGEPVELPFHLDRFALERDAGLRKALDGRGVKLLRDPDALEAVFLDHGRALLDLEIAFYEEQKETRQAGLLKEWRQAESVCLPVGYGTGWHAKTIGRLLDEGEIARVREVFNLGKGGVDLFPKTRKWACGPSGWQPMGWCKLEIVWK